MGIHKVFKSLLNWIRNLLAVVGFCGLLLVGYGSYQVFRSYNLPPRLFAQKALKKASLENTSFYRWLEPDPIRPAGIVFPAPDGPNWKGHGAREGKAMPSFHYSAQGYPIPDSWVRLGGAKSLGTAQKGNIVSVGNVEELLKSLRRAKAGDIITLRPGRYSIKATNIKIGGGGSLLQPIVVRAERLGTVFLDLDTLEGFLIDKPYWVFENLDIKGTGKIDSYCEHAFHVVGKGKGFVLRNSRVQEFNAMVKANGLNRGSEGALFPDGALIEGNSFFNSRPRQTNNAVAFIDVVGANNWVIRGNLIAEFGKGRGSRISYGAFIKGNSSGGVFENNLVIGEYRTSGGVRVGLSFGNGGTEPNFSRGGNGKVEHTEGIVRNNIVMYCGDVGLYLNKSRETIVVNNTLYRTMGIDVRFPDSSAVIKNNLLTGKIRSRDGGVVMQERNIFLDIDEFENWFHGSDKGDFNLREGMVVINKGAMIDYVNEDFCGEPRGKTPDLGAMEYSHKSKRCRSVLGL